MRFLSGDQNGLIKSIKINLNDVDVNGAGVSTSTITQDDIDPTRSVQKMEYNRETNKLSTARADSSIQQYEFNSEDKLNLLNEWNEPRFKGGDYYVGLSTLGRGLVAATSSGHWSYKASKAEEHYLSLPTNLKDMRVSPNGSTFAYGGLEVDLSIWDAKRALEISENTPTAPKVVSIQGATKKERKKAKDQLLDGEVWRAKNLPPDNLNLRVPIHITSLDYISETNIITGSANGSVRLYDTRASKKPTIVNNDLIKSSSVRYLRRGEHEYNVFVSDNNSNLFNVDIRNLKLINGYKGIGGAINTIAPTPYKEISLSGAMDKYLRLHTSIVPPEILGKNPTTKANIFSKVFVKSTPTVLEWDGVIPVEETKKRVERTPESDESEGELDDVLQDMETVTGEDMKVKRKAEGRRSKKKRV
ncbi:hypothetical protein E3Q06_03016 [Wallemia mellicola]|nr:hypothetical protein E3Q21_03030 [Wallemia mellicola]TIB85971.1 hypothetical protein E3Q20_03021 [Wallemia mellicola]TIC15983.1 hypothetical protein E3Q13_03147 [Wallemia mellicola]TIC34130.1 hypothetical protein E3Q09_03095 [Wallemia mellicola]TIC39389.1 hypothetical protein E3Q07_03038 [Wallemia mellicola]